jgi:aspartyl/asparaginyl beta-hydroxylase (cupin superfamily)
MSTPSPSFDDTHVRDLVRQAELAQSSGQRAEAERLLTAARASAPDHPLVMNASGVLELHRGNFAAARALIEQAIGKDAGNAAFWINLASTLRRLGLRDEEMQALQKALTIEPRHLLALLQKASLQDLTGKPREAARTYHHALQTIPVGAQLPESLRQPLQHAVRTVQENTAQLEAFVGERLKSVGDGHSAAERERYEHCIAGHTGKRRIYTPQPTFLLFPQLPALEFYPREMFPWLAAVEAASDEIRAEFERVFAEDAGLLEPYVKHPDGVPLDQWKELNHSKRWSVLYLWRDGKPEAANIARCPRTAALMQNVPRVDIPEVGPAVFFSVLDAKSHIPAHTGVTNTRTIVHIPLVIPEGCRFRVGSTTRPWRKGEAFVFDDTIEHEAWNDSDVPRAVLIFDIWNPFLTELEREAVRTMVTGIREYYGGHSPLAETK